MSRIPMIIAIIMMLSSRESAARSPTEVPAGQASEDASGSAWVLHVPHGQGVEYRPLHLVAVIEGLWREGRICAHYRPIASEHAFQELELEQLPEGPYYAAIPGDAMVVPGVEYYIAGCQEGKPARLHFASPEQPHEVRVSPDSEVRWRARELRRLGGRINSMAVSARFLDFSSGEGRASNLVRAELDWSHRLLGRLYAVTFGYGVLQGRAAGTDPPMDEGLAHRGRYGHGGVTLRLHHKVWLGGSGLIGVSHENTIGGGRVVLTFGEPWAAALQLGGEYIGDLGGSAWLRLQWDTVPRFAMAATIMRTSLAGGRELDGSVVTYDVRWQATSGLHVLGGVSLSARDGAVHVGGSIGSELRF